MTGYLFNIQSHAGTGQDNNKGVFLYFHITDILNYEHPKDRNVVLYYRKKLPCAFSHHEKLHLTKLL